MNHEAFNQQQLRPVPVAPDTAGQQRRGAEFGRVPTPVLWAREGVAWTRFLTADMSQGLLDIVIDAVGLAYELTQELTGGSIPLVEAALLDAEYRRRRHASRRAAEAEQIQAIEDELTLRRSIRHGLRGQ